jgi:hypothetical protein
MFPDVAAAAIGAAASIVTGVAVQFVLKSGEHNNRTVVRSSECPKVHVLVRPKLSDKEHHDAVVETLLT